MAELEIKKFIEEHTKIVQPLYKNMCTAFWNASISGKKEDYESYAEMSMQMQKIYNNKEDFQKLVSWCKEDISDKVLKRQLEIIYNSYLVSQGDINLFNELLKKGAALEHKFNTYRAKIEGKELSDNDIKEILKSETDSNKLKAAWEANKTQGEMVEKEVLEIIKLRNKIAKANGFANYYVMSLTGSEQTPEQIIGIFNELQNFTDVPFKKLKSEIDNSLIERYKIKEEELKPWHYHDLFFQEGPEIYKIDLDGYYQKDVVATAKKFYESLGLPVEDILQRSDLYEKKGKNQHAYCIDLDREGDVRILQNVKNNEKWMETTLHELGHAVYQKYIGKDLPFIIHDNAHTFVTESIAMLFGRLSKNISFIKEYSTIEEKDVSLISKEVRKMLRLRQLVFVRWAMVMVNFERSMYENPDQDLNTLWWTLVNKYQLINFSRNKPDWASKIHLVSSPVYYHNYALGELLASQIHNFITKNILNQKELHNIEYSNNDKIGEFLKNSVFSLGNRYRWDELIRKSTHEPLTAKYFVEQFVND